MGCQKGERTAAFLSFDSYGTALVCSWEGLLSRNSWGEALAAFCATTIQYLSSVFGRHTSQKSVGTSAFFLTWLPCSFHRRDLFTLSLFSCQEVLKKREKRSFQVAEIAVAQVCHFYFQNFYFSFLATKNCFCYSMRPPFE